MRTGKPRRVERWERAVTRSPKPLRPDLLGDPADRGDGANARQAEAEGQRGESRMTNGADPGVRGRLGEKASLLPSGRPLRVDQDDQVGIPGNDRLPAHRRPRAREVAEDVATA